MELLIFGRNLAEDSSVSTLLGSWISAIVMLPLGILLTRRATKDKGLFNIDVFLQPIINLIDKVRSFEGVKNKKTNDQ